MNKHTEIGFLKKKTNNKKEPTKKKKLNCAMSDRDANGICLN